MKKTRQLFNFVAKNYFRIIGLSMLISMKLGKIKFKFYSKKFINTINLFKWLLKEVKKNYKKSSFMWRKTQV